MPAAIAIVHAITELPDVVTDNTGGIDPENDIIAAIGDPATVAAMANLGPVLAATTTGKATQKDLNALSLPATLAAIVQPDVPRNVKLTITDGNSGISVYTITVAGKAPDGTSITEIFTFADGLTPAGSKIFASITSVTISALTGAGAADTLDLGYGTKLGVPLPYGSTGLLIVNLSIDGVVEASSATDTTNNSFIPTTAPNGTKLVKVFFAYNGPATTAIKAAIAQLAAKWNAFRASIVRAT